MNIYYDSVSLLVNGQPRYRMLGDPSLAANTLLGDPGDSDFLSIDSFQAVLSFTDTPNPAYKSYWGGWGFEVSDRLSMPTSIEWAAHLAEGFLSLDGGTGDPFRVVWALEGEQDFVLGDNIVSFTAGTQPQLLAAAGSRFQGPFLQLFFSFALRPTEVGPLQVPRVGDATPAAAHGLTQGPRSALRQEYVTFKASTIPAVSDVTDLVAPFNGGNYYAPARTVQTVLGGPVVMPEWGIGLDQGLAARFAKVLASYRGRVVVVEPAADTGLFNLNTSLLGNPYQVNGKPVFIPATAQLTLASAFRNPRRNVAIGSLYPVTSRHVWGRALDLVPNPVHGILDDGTTVPLSLNQHLYPTLLKAARTVGESAIGEHGSTPVPIGSVQENHVHLQW